MGLDENYKIIFANEEPIKIIGIKNENLIGNNAKDVALKNDLLRTLIKVLNPVKNE